MLILSMGERPESRIWLVLFTLIGLELLLHLYLLFHLNINWDEFFFLSKVYDWHRGELSRVFQTGYVHLFQWLPYVGENEVDQIIAARLVYFGLLIGSCAFVYLIGRRFLAREASLFAVFCVLAYSNVVLHGTSFRADGLAIFLILGALFFMTRRRRSRSATAGAAFFTAAAHFVTIKSVFFLPTLLAVAVLEEKPSGSSRLSARGAGVFLSWLTVFYMGLMSCHLLAVGPSESGDAAGFLAGAASKTILSQRLLPRSEYLLTTLIVDGFIWLYVVLGAAVLVARSYRRPRSREPYVLLSFLLPLASLLFYRNAFPYFYVFLLPPALILCGVIFERRLNALRARPGPVAAMILAIIVAGPVWTLSLWLQPLPPDGMSPQRAVIETVHRLFPKPVPYVDGSSMIASFTKVGFFMSTWGMENYREANTPVFGRLVADHGPVFLLANSRYLNFSDAVDRPGRASLLDEDRRFLKDHYVPFWGPLYLAGKTGTVTVGARTCFDILVPGRYRLDAPGPVGVDGNTIAPDRSLYLSRGKHCASTTSRQQPFVLRWDVGSRPAAPPPDVPLYRGFEVVNLSRLSK